MKRYFTVHSATLLLAILALSGCAGREAAVQPTDHALHEAHDSTAADDTRLRDFEILKAEYTETAVGEETTEEVQETQVPPPPAHAVESQQEPAEIHIELVELDGEPKAEPKAEIKVLDAPQPVGHMSEREAVAKIYMKAQELHYEGHHEEAKVLLQRIRPGQPYYDIVQKLIRKIDADIAALQTEIAISGELDQHRRDTVQSLYSEAQKSYNAKRYEDALILLIEATRLDPQNIHVRELLAHARQKRALDDEKIHGLHQDTRIAETMSEIERLATVPERLAPVERPKPPKRTDERLEEERQLDELLNQRISINLDSTPLDYLLNILFRTTGVNIIAKPQDLEGHALTLHVDNIRLIDLLNYISKTLGITFTRSGNALWLQGGGTVDTGPLMQWRVIPLHKGLMDTTSSTASTSSNLEKALNEIPKMIDWPSGSQWYLDRLTNSIVVRTTSESMHQFEEYVRAFDITPVQVLIETRFIEISSRAFEDLGIQWEQKSPWPIGTRGGKNRMQLSPGTGVSLPSLVTPPAGISGDAGLSTILAGVLTVPQFQITMRALAATGHTSNLGQPHIIAVNNSTAEIDITTDYYYVSDYEIDRQRLDGSAFGGRRDDLNGSSPDMAWATPVIKPRYDSVQVGFKLRVTPSVGSDLRDITLYLEPEIIDVVEPLTRTIAAAPELLEISGPLEVEQPIIARRKLTVKLTVSDGYVVALGGLVQQTKEEGVIKVPILGDIPVIGHLFRRKTEKNVKKNLLIFVSARILTSEGRTYVDSGPEEDDLQRARDLLDRVRVNVH